MTREMTVPRKQRLGPLVAAAAVLALTGGATALLARLDRTRAAERAAEEAQAAALRAADGVHGVIGALEVQAQNATTNPRLVAALDANVDQETLRDLLLTEPWWEPFRRAVDGYGLYSDESTGVVTSHLPPGFDGRTAIREARQGHATSSTLVAVGGQVYALCACPIALAGRTDALPIPSWLRILGSASYSIYLFQFVFIGIAWKLWLAAGLDREVPHGLAFVPLAVAGIGGGILMSRCVEHPLIRMVRRGGPRIRPRPAVG